jgi:hypothetical protein
MTWFEQPSSTGTITRHAAIASDRRHLGASLLWWVGLGLTATLILLAALGLDAGGSAGGPPSVTVGAAASSQGAA